MTYHKSVFINCPFDKHYLKFFDRLIFSVIDCGFIARSAQEPSNGGELRIDRLIKIIGECQYSIHDLSRTAPDKTTGLPRFNMPLELGVCIGAKKYGTGKQKEKDFLILDKKRNRYEQYISDIKGYDLESHDGKPTKICGLVRKWLAGKTSKTLPHGTTIEKRYQKFQKTLPKICDELGWTKEEMTFVDKTHAIQDWLEAQT